jgi:hypothetical protein
MAINRFSQIQGLPEWQPDLPLDIALKGLMYKQELFEKNKQLIDKSVSDSENLADQILNPHISSIYKEKINSFKKNLVDNFSTADLSNDLVTSSIASGLEGVIDDDMFATHIKKSKDAKQALGIYKAQREKGDPNYSEANEYFTQLSVMNYMDAEADKAANVSIVGYQPKVDYLKIMNDALKDMKDYADVTAEITEHGLMFFNKSREVVSAGDIMAALKPQLTPAVIGQMNRDAQYKFRGDLSTLEQSATSGLVKRNENIDEQIASLKQNIAMNPSNSRTHKINQNYIKQLENQKAENNKEIESLKQKIHSNNPDDVNAVKFNTLYNDVMSGMVAKYGFEKTKIDIKANEGAIAIMKEDRQDAREARKLAWEKEKFKIELELAGGAGGIPGAETEIPAELDPDDFTQEAISLKLDASRQALGNSKMNLAKILESYAAENGSAGLFITTDAQGRPTINESNLEAFIHGKNLYSKKSNEVFSNRTLSNQKIKSALIQYENSRLEVRSNEEYMNRADDYAVKINPALAAVVNEGKKLFRVDEKSGDVISKQTYTLNKLAQFYDQMGYNGFAAIYGGDAAEKVKNFHGKKYTKAFENAREKAYEEMATYTKTMAKPVPGATVTRRDKDGMFKTSDNPQFLTYLLRIKDNQSNEETREGLANSKTEDLEYLDSYIDPKTKSTVHRVRVVTKTESGTTSGTVYKVVDVPNSRYSIKQSEYQANVGRYLLPDSRGGYSTTISPGGLPLGQNGINRFAVEQDEYGTRFRPYDMRNNSFNEDIAQLLDTREGNALFQTPDDIYNFVNFADSRGKDIGQMSTKEFMEFVTSYNK